MNAVKHLYYIFNQLRDHIHDCKILFIYNAPIRIIFPKHIIIAYVRILIRSHMMQQNNE